MITLFENAYIDLDYADAMPELKYLMVWSEMQIDEKESYLINAAKLIDRINFIGAKELSTQPMAWPRVFADDELSGYPDYYYDTDSINNALAIANCQQAAYMLRYPKSNDLKNSPVMKDDIDPKVKDTLRPYVIQNKFMNVYQVIDV